ncbi:nucleotide sugar dehydrogenase [Halorussus salinus]|uniref:nucleotide sugar dehydrogenase n=1 Tax=Halorussus salinus TaxID=1364935 RepID=UPI00138F032B|nr:nucleotide sugar dehydrogenase [Halorussus salinus]
MDIAIIGGAGHVGLPMSLVLGDAGHDVTLVDTDEEKLEAILDAEMPFSEPGAKELLAEQLATDGFDATTDIDGLDCDAYVVVVGTPIDEHNNPQMDNLLDIIRKLRSQIGDGELVVLRSTVYPGTTDIVRSELEKAGHEVGEDVYLSFAPERIAQHNALEEIIGLPQLIGVFEDESYVRTRALFESFLEAECPRLTPTEAELGKLFTNMWRYLTFAAANEFYLITESFATNHDVNVHRILDKTARNYPRFDVPSPGANVGGPCLTKDGWFLVDNIPYNELVTAAFQINEGMPAQIVNSMLEKHAEPDKVTILGMTFKPNSDDTRNSVAFKLEKQLQYKGINDIVRIEPNKEGFDDWDEVKGSDWVILMTPHDEFADLQEVHRQVDNDECTYCDIWGFWEKMRYDSENGFMNALEFDFDEAQTKVL